MYLSKMNYLNTPLSSNLDKMTYSNNLLIAISYVNSNIKEFMTHTETDIQNIDEKDADKLIEHLENINKILKTMEYYYVEK